MSIRPFDTRSVDLGDFIKCSICKEHGWTNTHKCPPAWRVRYRDEDYAEDPDEPWTVIYANAAGEAAEKFIAHEDKPSALDQTWAYDEADVEVVVKSEIGGDEKIFVVECSLRPSYLANQL
jgi:hypothetical protein